MIMRVLMKLIDDEVFNILSNPLRLKIMQSLCDSSLSFTALKNKFKINPNSLSRQLNKLVGMNLIRNYYRKSEGRDYSFYSITDKGLRLLREDIIFPLQMRLLTRFKGAKQQDWVWQEFGDIVKVDGKYHSFLVAAMLDNLPPTHFLKVSRARKAAFVDRTAARAPRIVSVSYVAWFFGAYSARISNLLRYLVNELSHTTAIYCLALHRSVCFVYNHTDSVVFKEFERFLKDVGLRLEPFPKELFKT